MNRAQRRAAAHATRKAERKAGFPQSVTANNPNPVPASETEPVVAPPASNPAVSSAQLEANRRNSKLSTGPKPENRYRVAQNALKHGLTGRAVLLPSEDAEQYQAFVQSFFDQFQPVGLVESHHVQSLADIGWRLERITYLEFARIASGRRFFEDLDPETFGAMTSAEVEYLVRERDEKAFRNLELQEQRLVRRRAFEMRALSEIQEIRKAREAKEQEVASQPAASPENGFVFSNSPINSNSSGPNIEKSETHPPEEVPPAAKAPEGVCTAA